MNITKVIYTPERVIKICVSKTDKDEQQQLVPDLVQYAVIFYTIGLIDKPETVIEEAYRISNKKVKIYKNIIVLFFSLDELNQVENCEITINSLVIFLSSRKKFETEFGRTFQFEEIYTTKDLLDIKAPEVQSNKKQKQKQIEPTKKTVQVDKSFKESYEKFKVEIEDSSIGDLIRNKSKPFDHALKEFGISLLCRVLMAVSHLNVLLKNDFKSDLNSFLRLNVLNLHKEVREA